MFFARIGGLLFTHFRNEMPRVFHNAMGPLHLQTFH